MMDTIQITLAIAAATFAAAVTFAKSNAGALDLPLPGPVMIVEGNAFGNQGSLANHRILADQDEMVKIRD